MEKDNFVQKIVAFLYASFPWDKLFHKIDSISIQNIANCPKLLYNFVQRYWCVQKRNKLGDKIVRSDLVCVQENSLLMHTCAAK